MDIHSHSHSHLIAHNQLKENFKKVIYSKTTNGNTKQWKAMFHNFTLTGMELLEAMLVALSNNNNDMIK